MHEIGEYIAPILPDTPGSAVYERFEREPDLLAIPVVREDGVPVGLVDRHAFSLKMGGRYGHSLYAGRPIHLLMNPDPILVDAGADIIAFTGGLLADRPSDLLRGFIVTRAGRYAGVGSALCLLREANANNARHLAAAYQQLQDRAEFLSVMSHEIRTPLNGVLSVAEIMARELTQPDLKPHVGAIIDSGNILLRLVNEALDYFRGQAGALDLREEPFAVAEILGDLDSLWRPKAEEAGVALSLSFQGEPDLWALGDAVRLKQVFNNLIGNALKFCDSGAVEVELSARIEDIYVEIGGTVRDDGPGIPAERLESVFDPFAQTDAGRRYGGAGLGLSICRQIVEKMSGSIGVESAPGQGSAFRFDLLLFSVPVGAAEASAPAPTPEPPYKPHILIADDNPTNRFVAEKLCALFGCTSESVEDGDEAVPAAAAGRFDLVLMDIKMPRMDGLEAMRAIRRLPSPLCALPIIALTANADPWDAAHYLEQGMDAVVEKPIRPEQLMAGINRVLAVETQAAA